MKFIIFILFLSLNCFSSDRLSLDLEVKNGITEVFLFRVPDKMKKERVTFRISIVGSKVSIYNLNKISFKCKIGDFEIDKSSYQEVKLSPGIFESQCKIPDSYTGTLNISFLIRENRTGISLVSKK